MQKRNSKNVWKQIPYVVEENPQKKSYPKKSDQNSSKILPNNLQNCMQNNLKSTHEYSNDGPTNPKTTNSYQKTKSLKSYQKPGCVCVCFHTIVYADCFIKNKRLILALLIEIVIKAMVLQRCWAKTQ